MNLREDPGSLPFALILVAAVAGKDSSKCGRGTTLGIIICIVLLHRVLLHIALLHIVLSVSDNGGGSRQGDYHFYCTSALLAPSGIFL